MEIKLNGESRRIEPGMTISKLIAELDLEPRNLAIEHNGNILEDSDLNETKLEDGDTLEIIRFVGGG